MELSKKPQSGSEPAVPRKPYKQPKLEKYGNLKEITRSNAAGNTADGMGGQNMQKSLP